MDIAQDAKASKQGVISATAAAGVTIIGKKNVKLVNVGAHTAFIRFNDDAIATVSDFPLLKDVNQVFSAGDGQVIQNVRHICAGGEAASINYIAWD